MKIPEITVQELNELRKANTNFLLLDVRNPDEYEICNLGGMLLPLAQLPERVKELNSEQPIVIHCHSGARSHRAAEFLIQRGFKKVYNLSGGITAWANEIDKTMRKY